jgi:hypothetical protein
MLSAALCLCLCARAGVALAKPNDVGQWVVISDGILTELGKTHPKSSDPNGTLTAGVSVDRKTGDVYLLANNIGICKSRDQGQTFKLVSGNTITGRFETACGLNIDPSGGRLMCFTIYGSSAYSRDSGRTWTQSSQGHLDYGAVDWNDTGKTLLAIGHESGGKLMLSVDAGGHWKTLGTNYWGTGLFTHQILLATLANEDGIVRSTDGGTTWSKVSHEPVASPVMVDFKGIGYWLGQHGLLESLDRGLTWKIVGPVPAGASVGPIIGKDARDMVIGSPDGLYKSHNGGQSWALAAPLAPEITVLQGGKWATYGWDPIHDIFYASQMSKPAFRYVVSH